MACYGSESSKELEHLMLSCSPEARKRRKSQRLSLRGATGSKKTRIEVITLDLDSPEREIIAEDCASVIHQCKKLPMCFFNDDLMNKKFEELLVLKPSFDLRACYSRLVDLRKRLSTEYATWTSKYAPTDTDEVLGNWGALSRLKTWLVEWKMFIQKDDDSSSFRENIKIPNGRCLKNNQDSSFSKSSYSEPDEDSDDSFGIPVPEEMPQTGFMIYGPPGVGKTASIHALAKELDFAVIEINPASSKDAKQILLQSLEATQSHSISVAREKNVIANFFKLKDQVKPEVRPPNTLVLIDDADVLPEGEETFISAVEDMLRRTKRPVIFTVSGVSKVRLIQAETLVDQVGDVDFIRQPRRDIVCYISLLALVEYLHLDLKQAWWIANSTNGDLRAAVNLAQFHASEVSAETGRIHTSSIEITPEPVPGVSSVEQNRLVCEDSSDITAEITEHLQDMVAVICSNSSTDWDVTEIHEQLLEQLHEFQRCRSLPAKESPLLHTFRRLDSLSFSSVITTRKLHSVDPFHFWKDSLLAGVSESFYEDPSSIEDRVCAFRSSDEVTEHVMETIRNADQKLVLEGSGGCSSVIGEHGSKTGKELFYQYGRYNPEVHIRGSCFGTDYWSFIRVIASSELQRRKLEEFTKRRRLRFYHYLGQHRLYLTDGLLDQLSYRIGEKLELGETFTACL